jgi:hypothetical protein
MRPRVEERAVSPVTKTTQRWRGTVVRGTGAKWPPERIPAWGHLRAYLAELALAAEPIRLPRRHVTCAGVADDSTGDG